MIASKTRLRFWIIRVLVSLALGLVLMLARNFSFQFNETVIYLTSIGLGVVLGSILRYNRLLLIGPVIFLLFLPPFMFGKFLPLTDYLTSAIPLFSMSALVYFRKRIWSVIFPIAYYVVVLFVIFYYFENRFLTGVSNGKSLSDLNLVSIESGAPYNLPEGKNGYLLAYWHRGCGYCIRLEEALNDFKAQTDLNVHVVSVEARGEEAELLEPYIEKWHNSFPNFQDRNRVVQELTETNAGPVLVLADQNQNIKDIYIGYSRDIQWFGSLYWNYKVGSYTSE